MATHKLYESATFTAAWNGVDILEGIAADVFLTIEPRSPRVSVTTGADGKDARAKMANKGCIITATLQMTSNNADNIFNQVFVQDVVGANITLSNFAVEDAHGVVKFLALNAVLTEVPTWEFNNGETVPEITFTWEAVFYLMGSDLSSVQSSIQALTQFV